MYLGDVTCLGCLACGKVRNARWRPGEKTFMINKEQSMGYLFQRCGREVLKAPQLCATREPLDYRTEFARRV